MRRASWAAKVFSFFIVSLMAAAAGVAEAATLFVGSNPSWIAFDAKGNSLGFAQNVCLNKTAPPTCPNGAAAPDTPTLYGYPLIGWGANLAPIPGAKWIYAPNIAGSTTGAAGAEFTFKTDFAFCGPSKGGTIWVAADNSAEVRINGKLVLTVTDSATLKSATIAAADLMSQAMNTIEIKVKNFANPGDCSSGEYKCNPAGFVFGGKFEDALPSLPTCSYNGQTLQTGQQTKPEPFSCQAGQVGTSVKICACGFLVPVNQCVVLPPVTCMDNGKTFKVGETQPVLCPSPKVGNGVRACQSTGMWGSPDFSRCADPPVTCTNATGARLPVGATESIKCSPGPDELQLTEGSQTRQCQANGTWKVTAQMCTMAFTTRGQQCGDVTRRWPQYRQCPTGTSCHSRVLGNGVQTTAMYCDP